MTLSLSRGSSIDAEKCVKNAGGNKFNLILIAAARARELSRQHKASESTVQVNAPVTALLEVQSGEIGQEYLKRIK